MEKTYLIDEGQLILFSTSEWDEYGNQVLGRAVRPLSLEDARTIVDASHRLLSDEEGGEHYFSTDMYILELFRQGYFEEVSARELNIGIGGEFALSNRLNLQHVRDEADWIESNYRRPD